MGSSGAHPRDSDLVVAAREGQAWALTEIWQLHAPAVNGYLRGRGAIPLGLGGGGVVRDRLAQARPVPIRLAAGRPVTTRPG